MPTINNYTFSEPVFTIPEQSNIVSQVGATAVITITPDPGFVASATDFSATSFDTTYITNVAFSQSGNNVLCTITLDSSTVMPSNNLTLGLCVSGSPHEVLLTIEGKYSATVGSNVTGNSSETDVPYSKSNARSEFSHILTRTYNAASGYFWGGSNIPSINVVTGNQKYYLINQTPTFDSSNRLTNITYDIGYLFPDKSVSGDVISINVPSTQQIYVPLGEISGYKFNTAGLGNLAETRRLVIFGSEGAAVTAVLNDGSTSTTIINNETITSSGKIAAEVEFPEIITPELYTKTGAPSLIQSNFTQIDTGWSFSNGVASIDGTQTGTSRIKGGIGGATIVSGKTYAIELNANITSCRIELAGGGNFVLTGTQENINGIAKFLITATAAHTLISILCGANDVGSISSLSIKEEVQIKNYALSISGDLPSSGLVQANPANIKQRNKIFIRFSSDTSNPISGISSIGKKLPALLTTPFTNPGNYKKGKPLSSENLQYPNGVWYCKIEDTITASSGTISVAKTFIEISDFTNAETITQQVTSAQSNVTSLQMLDTTGIVAGMKFNNTPQDANVSNNNGSIAPFNFTVSNVNSSTELSVTPAITVRDNEILGFNLNNGNYFDIYESKITSIDSTNIKIEAKMAVYRTGDLDTNFILNLDNLINHTP